MRLDVYRDGEYLGGYHVGSADGVRIGRGLDNQVILPHPAVSRCHATLIPEGEGYLLLDSSTNGTFIDGRLAHEVTIGPGIRFSVGPFILSLAREKPVTGGGGPGWDRPTEMDARVPEKYGMVGESPAMLSLFDLIPRVAASSGTVLVLGETGSGKELVARAVHDASPRSSGPFVAINCGAISPDLVESELFGHEKGSFTGAVAARRGAFEEASGGTLFLDEVGELSRDLQPKLLRVLETGEIRRVGAQSPLKVDVRVVAATHRDLQGSVAQGHFRPDLLYRLFVLPLVIPPLRERRDDIPLLTRFFLGERARLGPQAMDRLMAHSWPGNIRELKNVLERATILCGGGVVGAEELIFLEEKRADSGNALTPVSLPETMEELERIYYRRAMEKSEGNIRAAARSLGIPKSTFFERLKRYGLEDVGTGEAREKRDETEGEEI